MDKMQSYRHIEFPSQGATLRGRLYLPEREDGRAPVVVMAHGFTTTISGMTADKYAEALSGVGYAVLLYDHRNLGISDGEPRQEVNFWVQARGYIDAINFLFTRSAIDTGKIALWGASLSAREAFLVASVDERVGACINLIPAYGRTLPAEDQNDEIYAFAQKTVRTERISELPHSSSGPMAIVSGDQLNAPSVLEPLTAYRWFIEYGGRFGSGWKNVVSISNTEMPEAFHIAHCAPYLHGPVLMIVAKNDEMEGADPEITAAVYGRVKEAKEWLDIEGGHFGLLHFPGAIFDRACKAQIDFLDKYLK